MFQSKVFKRIFFSYLLIIAISMSAYAVFLIYQSREIARTQTARENELLMTAVTDLVDDRLDAARDVVRELRYSTVMRDLYMAARLGSTLDTYDDYAVQTELRSILSAHSGDFYGFTIFLDGSERAYSAGGVAHLITPFDMPDRELPFLCRGSIADTLQLKDNKRYYFSRPGLLYCDGYTWQSGTRVGICCVFIDAGELEQDLGDILGDTHGVQFMYDGEELLSAGVIEGKPVLEAHSDACEAMRILLYGTSPAMFGTSVFLFGMLLVFALIALLFIWLAWRQSKRYYQPIGALSSMMSEAGEEPQADEMDGILNGIRSLIGEKNRYHEKMLTIGPYAGAGMLQAIVEGGEKSDRISILADEDYLDLKRPYYVVAVVNFAAESSLYTRSTAGGQGADEGLREKLDEIFRQTAGSWSTEERRITWYFRDVFNVYLIVGDDVPELSEDLFLHMHRQIAAAVAGEHLLVSMGVDRTREDIGELGEACEGALSALDGVLHDGRGEVFFAGELKPARTEYYLPAGFGDNLRAALERRDRDSVHHLLFDIYKKNLDLDAPAEVYRALLDEFYPALVRAAREATGRITVHLNIRRTAGLMTLQEIFDYYDAVLMSVIDLLEQNDGDREETPRPDEEILAFMEEHYCDRDMSLQLLSDRFEVSNKYLLLLFRQRYGMTYLQYLQDKRIRRAAAMIREKTHTLTEIGDLVGYPNQLTFRRNFKAVMGVNPSEYASSQ